MKKSLDKAWGIVKKYREATKKPSPGRVPRIRSKALFEEKLTLAMPTKHKYTTPQASKVKASMNKSSHKRKRR